MIRGGKEAGGRGDVYLFQGNVGWGMSEMRVCLVVGFSDGGYLCWGYLGWGLHLTGPMSARVMSAGAILSLKQIRLSPQPHLPITQISLLCQTPYIH